MPPLGIGVGTPDPPPVGVRPGEPPEVELTGVAVGGETEVPLVKVGWGVVAGVAVLVVLLQLQLLSAPHPAIVNAATSTSALHADFHIMAVSSLSCLRWCGGSYQTGLFSVKKCPNGLTIRPVHVSSQGDVQRAATYYSHPDGQ